MTEAADELGRSTRSMAVGTVASRGTGFVKNAAIAAVLGVTGVGAAFNVANTTPNIVYELLLGGILTSILVPVLIRAATDDEESGQVYAQQLLTLVVVVLLVASAALVLLAPQLVGIYAANAAPADRDLAVVLARFFLPQMLFYGAGAVMGAILNTRGHFRAPMWAPVVNNVVVIATCALFLTLPGISPLRSGSITTAQVVVLGVGTTLGIVAQTIALVPSLRAAGFSFRPRWGLPGIGNLGRLARWVLLYVIANQIAYVVVVRLANDDALNATGRGYAAYVNAFVLWQLPHAVVAVSVITALLPRMSRAAADERLDDLREQLNRGLRLTVTVLVPAAVAYLVLGRVLATVVFGHLRTTDAQAHFIGVLLAVFAFGLVPFSVYQLQLRAFYALQDTRTPTLINLCVNVTLVVVDVTLYALLPDRYAVLGLAAGHACSFVAGLLLCSYVLSRRIGGLDGARVVRTAVRCLVAVALPALIAAAAVAGLVGQLGTGQVGSLSALLVGAAILGGGYLLAAHRLRITELDDVVGPVLHRLGLSRSA